MAKKTQPWRKILDHIDRDEIISKIAADTPPDDIHEWLEAKYSLAAERDYVLSVAALKAFRDNYFDFYQTLKTDLAIVKAAPASEQLDLVVKNSPAYRDALKNVLNHEIDLKLTISRLCAATETRLGQIYDIIQENYEYDRRDVSTKLDYVLIQYVNALTPLLEKADKIINNAPDQIVQHNITVQHIDQTIGVFYEAIRDTLSEMSLQDSMVFMEKFNEKLARLRDPANTPSNRLQEVKELNSTINAVLDD